ncbi:MAG: serine hydrolase [Bacteroidales bacterium]|nr:serine hydrolase [Bacteroidales bacterium]
MRTLAFVALFLSVFYTSAQNLYFPPISNAANWDTISPSTLGWNIKKIAPLYDFLEQQNSKAFIVLKDGKIVLEKYFGSFTKDSAWYWASAGKTLTSFLVGTAQEGGLLSISDPSSKYLGAGWSNCTPTQEQNITIRHHLTMTTGLDDGVPDNHCTDKSCLNYLAEPGTRWAYHNAAYNMLEKVITTASKQNINTYTQSKLLYKTGITGLWLTVDYDNVFYSKPRSMARFGLLAMNRFVWGKDTILHDKEYVNQMITPSQDINKSYGYLWWLNGKKSYMLPSTQLVFPASLAPDAPTDMYAGIGKNGQLVCISPSQGIVMVRMGNPANDFGEVSTVLCNQIWQRLHEVINTSAEINQPNSNQTGFTVTRTSTTSQVFVNVTNENASVQIMNINGKLLLESEGEKNINVSPLPFGIYIIKITSENRIICSKFVR